MFFQFLRSLFTRFVSFLFFVLENIYESSSGRGENCSEIKNHAHSRLFINSQCLFRVIKSWNLYYVSFSILFSRGKPSLEFSSNFSYFSNGCKTPLKRGETPTTDFSWRLRIERFRHVETLFRDALKIPQLSRVHSRTRIRFVIQYCCLLFELRGMSPIARAHRA